MLSNTILVRPSVCLSVCLSVCPSVCPSVRPSVRPSVCPSVRPPVHQRTGKRSIGQERREKGRGNLNLVCSSYSGRHV